MEPEAITYQTSCFWPETRAAGLSLLLRLMVAQIPRVSEGVVSRLVGVVVNPLRSELPQIPGTDIRQLTETNSASTRVSAKAIDR